MKFSAILGVSIVALLGAGCGPPPDTETPLQPLVIPRLEAPPLIDGNLSEWKYHAFTDGVWDLARVRQTTWFEPSRNRLTDHGETASPEEDLQARYYLAWDPEYLYLGAEVQDNVNDVTESRHAPKRWYYKDAIAWFIEAPADTLNESFGAGDHGFAFVADTSYPDYGAWWRRGTVDSTYLEDPLPGGSAEYVVKMDSSSAGFTLEARIHLEATLGQSDPRWRPPREGDLYRLMIVHCDPDGGEYGGHLLIYGQGDADSSWHPVLLGGPATWEERKKK